MTTYSAKIPYMPGLSAPDDYELELGCRPSDNFVVARTRNGSAASLYGDNCWDRSSYSPDERSERLYFDIWNDEFGLTEARQQLVAGMKWVLFLLIYVRKGHGAAFNTLVTYMQTLRAIARYCDVAGVTIGDVLGSPELSMAFMGARATGRSTVAIQQILREIGPDIVGFSAPTKDEIAKLRKVAKDWRKDCKQHPPIPTRLYSSILAAQSEYLEHLVAHLDTVLDIAKDCYEDPRMGLCLSNQIKISARVQDLRPTFPEILQERGLEDFWAQNKFEVSRVGIRAYLVEVLYLASLQVLGYTGMRQSEVATLPYDCLDVVDRERTTHVLVNGRVTKLTKGKVKRVRWVTNSLGHDAIVIAQRIAKNIYSAKGTPPDTDTNDANSFYLFVTPLYLSEHAKFGKNTHISMGLYSHRSVQNRIVPKIAKEDLRELLMIDPHRDWGSEDKYKVGEAWPLSAHQYRRSLALYAQRSGLVSLPTLKRQLQHITLEMSQYYARGSGFALDFIGSEREEKHFGEEWQETQPISQYLSYATHVLLEHEQNLFGSHSQWVRTRLKDRNGLMLESRETTLIRFQKGEMAYMPTPVGGCTNPGTCDKNPIDVLHVECVTENCKHLVGNFTKTERVIKIKSRELEAMRKSSSNLPELMHEEAELKKLLTGFAAAQEGRSWPKGST